MNRTLRTIVQEDVQRIFDHFCYSFNIRILLYTPDGEILRVGLNRPDSDFCLMVRRLYGESRCLTMDDAMRRQSAEEHRLLFYTCHAGLNESIEPIYVRDVLIGYAMIGQFRSGGTIAEHVLRDWEQEFGPTAELRAAFESLPAYDEVTRDHIIGLFRVLVEYVVSKEMIGVEGSLLVERIKTYLRQNTDRAVTLTEVAARMQRSCSTISHTVREHCGCSFKQLYTEIKVQKADELMTAYPGLSIAEVVDKLGYSDQFYFSRVYKKVRGYPPSDYLTRIEPDAAAECEASRRVLRR